MKHRSIVAMFRDTSTSKKKNLVLEHRDGRDAYTKRDARDLGEYGNVDHVLELQLIEFAAGEIIGSQPRLKRCFSDAVNAVPCLNLTTRRVNQSKKGPFTAALNRLRKGEKTDLEALARSGRGKWLVDEGVWENIEKEIVLSYENIEKTLEEQTVTRQYSKALQKATEAIRQTLEDVKVFV